MTLRGSLFQIYTLMANFIVKKERWRIKYDTARKPLPDLYANGEFHCQKGAVAYKLTCCAVWNGSLFQIYTLTENFIVKKEGVAYKTSCGESRDGRCFQIYTLTGEFHCQKGRGSV